MTASPTPEYPPLPDTPDAAVAALAASRGASRRRLLKASRERFRGLLFNALLEKSRSRFGDGAKADAGELLELAAYVGRHGIDAAAQAKCWFAISSAWQDYGRTDEAIACFRTAARLFRRAGVRGGEARVLARWAQAEAGRGHTRLAVRRYWRALRLAHGEGDGRLAAQIDNNLGAGYRRVGDYRGAERAFRQAVLDARRAGDESLACRAQGSQGLALFELGRYERAEAALSEAVRIAQSVGDRRLEASHTGDLGNVCRATGRLAEAEDHFRRALALAQELGDQRYEELGLGNLGALLFQRGHLHEAVALLQQAGAIGETIGELADAGRDAFHLSIVYRELGDGPAESAALARCLQFARSAGDYSLAAGALLGAGYRAMSDGNWQAAEHCLEQADAANRLAADPYNDWATPAAQGNLAYHHGDYTTAGRYWATALELADKAGNIFGALDAEVSRASALIMLGQPAAAEAILRDALRRAREFGLPDDERLIWESLGQSLELQKDRAGARESYEEALALIESGRAALGLESHRIGYFGGRSGPYIRLTWLLVRWGQAGAAWEVVERARSRAFLDLLAQGELPRPAGLPAAL